MVTEDSKRLQCVVCGDYFERTTGVVGRDSKHCQQCSPPKPKKTDTNSVQVVMNSKLLSRVW
jgi:hypothetical protein